jgi:hypothetical protein
MSRPQLGLCRLHHKGHEGTLYVKVTELERVTHPALLTLPAVLTLEPLA